METVFGRVDGLIIESHRLKSNGQIAEHITRLTLVCFHQANLGCREVCFWKAQTLSQTRLMINLAGAATHIQRVTLRENSGCLADACVTGETANLVGQPKPLSQKEFLLEDTALLQLLLAWLPAILPGNQTSLWFRNSWVHQRKSSGGISLHIPGVSLGFCSSQSLERPLMFTLTLPPMTWQEI